MKKMNNQSGLSLIEMLVATVLLGISMMAAAFFVSTSFHTTKHNNDKDFAVQKSIAMLEELKSLVEVTNGGDVTLLDDYDDGIKRSYVLTTEKKVTDPAHASSGNLEDAYGWKYERQISVRKFNSLQANDVRLVNVRVYGHVDGKRNLLAETAGVIRTIADNYPPSQVYDLYLIAIENVPGWWVYMANLIPFVESAVQDLQARNPGLEFRTHWIRTLSYGRDREYMPYMNQADDSTEDIDYAYFYPATMPSGSAVHTYYVPSGMRGQINIDGTVTNGYDAANNPMPYALADHFNHAMRLEDERALFNTRVALGLEDPGSPTLRLLLEDMYSNPENYLNSLIINVHGELFPFPPFRNYSDAAKEPEGHPYVRVVTHPENLTYDNNDDLRLRVYSYLTEPTTANNVLNEPISVYLPGIFPAPGELTVTTIEGGIGAVDYNFDIANDTVDNGGFDMYYEETTLAGGTLIELYRSPLKCPKVGNRGLDPDQRLYGMDYIPSPINGTAVGWDRNLTENIDRTQNTARWIINIDENALPDDSRIDIETRIGDDLTTGTLYPTRNEPTNLSRTYTWRGTDDWLYGDGTRANPGNMPLTERYQIVGDPRHVPYLDTQAAYHATNNPVGLGYNRYFDDFHDSSGNYATQSAWWPGWQDGVHNNGGRNDDGWRNRLEVDVNRAFQTMRQAVMRSNALWTTMTGFSYYYMGIGNEIGYDCANGFCNSIPVSSKPFDGTSGTRNENSITTSQSGGVKYIRANGGGSDWWGVNWIGELYPDDVYATQWKTDGNLDAGSGADRFVRERRDNITANLPTGTDFTNAQRRTQQEGSTTFFSVGSAGSKFHHDFWSGTGQIQSKGSHIASGYNFGIPDEVFINRPFNFNRNGSGGVPDHYLEATYTNGVTITPTELAQYFDHPSGTMSGSSLIGIDAPGDDMGFIVVNGIGQTIETGSAFMSRWSMLTLLHSYMVAGKYAGTERIPQLPRIKITQPSDTTDLDDPGSITVKFDRSWRRWDNNKYTPDYSFSDGETTPLDYVTMYSEDNGSTWKYMQNDSPAEPGMRPTGSTPVISSTQHVWPTPGSKFPKGSYVVRVEAHRQDQKLHYAYHQQKIFIKR